MSKIVYEAAEFCLKLKRGEIAEKILKKISSVYDCTVEDVE